MQVTFQGNPLHLLGTQVKVGDKAKDFTCAKQDLSPFKFSDVKAKVKVISVVPSLDTGVCQIQTKHFNKEASSLKDVRIITISVDLPFAQGRFCGAEGIKNIDVVSDYANRDFAEKYGMLIDELKILTRSVVVIDKDDTVKYVEYLKEITNEPDYASALECVKSLL